MSKVILYAQSSGAVAMVVPAPDCFLTVEEIAQKDVPSGTPYHIVEKSEISASFAFFNSWVFSTAPEIVVDLGKAKVQYKQAADAAAASLSQPLTQEYMRLMSIGGDTTAVQAQLQAINAAAEETAYLDATSVDALIACWPPELGPNPFLPVSNEAE
jgi:hypothetical protein